MMEFLKKIDPLSYPILVVVFVLIYFIARHMERRENDAPKKEGNRTIQREIKREQRKLESPKRENDHKRLK